MHLLVVANETVTGRKLIEEVERQKSEGWRAYRFAIAVPNGMRSVAKASASHRPMPSPKLAQ